jgi:hypothetical protein
MRSRLRGEQSLGDRAALATEERVQPCRLGQVDSDLDDAPRTSSAHPHRCLRLEGRGSLRHGGACVRRRRRRQRRSRRISRGGGRARGGGAARRRGRDAGKRGQGGRGGRKRGHGHRHGNDRHGCRHATHHGETILRCRRCAARESAREEKACGEDAGAGADPRCSGESVPSGSGTVRGQRGSLAFRLGDCERLSTSPDDTCNKLPPMGQSKERL